MAQMIFGAMNKATKPLENDLRTIAASGFHFVELMFEPPLAWLTSGVAGDHDQDSPDRRSRNERDAVAPRATH